MNQSPLPIIELFNKFSYNPQQLSQHVKWYKSCCNASHNKNFIDNEQQNEYILFKLFELGSHKSFIQYELPIFINENAQKLTDIYNHYKQIINYSRIQNLH